MTLNLVPEPDYFFNEVRRVHEFRDRLGRLSVDERALMALRLGAGAERNWSISARGAQLPPLSLEKDWCWLFLGGRGTGKSKAMSGAVHLAVRAGVQRIHVIGPTTADLHDILLDGPAGILRTAGVDPMPRWLSTRRRLEWPNGAQAVFFSGEEPESLRGPQCQLCIAAGSLVAMENGGQVPIEKVKVGDKIVTPLGSRCVTWRGQTRRNAETIIIQTSSHRLNLTGNHQVYVARKGWTRADQIKPGDPLIAFGMPTVGGGANARRAITSITTDAGSTCRSTRIISGRCPTVSMSITRTETRAITNRPTLRAFRLSTISACTRASRFIRQNGMPGAAAQSPPRFVAVRSWLYNAVNVVRHFIGEMGSAWNFAVAAAGTSGLVASSRNISVEWSGSVLAAERRSLPEQRTASFAPHGVICEPRASDINRSEGASPKPSSARSAESSFNRAGPMPDFASETAPSLSIVRVEQISNSDQLSDCYDISVDEAACFFADGILVHNCVVDEIARMRYQQAVFDQLFLGLRLGARPRVLIATTPRPTPFMKRLVAMKGVSITTGSTYDNAQHLSPEFMRKIRELYEGTRIGRQELHGAMLLDPQNALFKDDWIVRDAVDEALIEQATVGVDPSGGGDEIGIVVAAVLQDGRYAVLADRTLSASPAQWGDEVVRAHDEFNCDDVVVERNFGGDMAIDVVKQAADRAMQAQKRPHNYIRVKEVIASRGKAMRAEPISLLYERSRVLHRNGLDQLEGEMMAFSREWDRAVDGSPNRLDAMVWALSRLSDIKMEIPMA
jgi:phage terminase large subunit-like protein